MGSPRNETDKTTEGEDTSWMITEEDMENATEFQSLPVDLELEARELDERRRRFAAVSGMRTSAMPLPRPAVDNPREEYELARARQELERAKRQLELDLERNPPRGAFRRNKEVPTGRVDLLDEEAGGCHVVAQRILWANGKYTDPRDGTKAIRDATLIVLKFRLSSISRKNPLQYLRAQLSLKAAPGSKANDDGSGGPEVVAWAPFNRVERGNKNQASISKGTEASGGVQVGYEPIASATAAFSRTKSVEWPRTYFDECSSMALAPGPRPVGVQWELKQNELESSGVMPYFFAAVLIARPPADAPYFVKLSVQFHNGGWNDLLQRAGLKTYARSFSCKPKEHTDEVVVLEGRDVHSRVDFANLAALVDPEHTTELRIPYGLVFDESDTPAFVVPPAAADDAEAAAMINETADAPDELYTRSPRNDDNAPNYASYIRNPRNDNYAPNYASYARDPNSPGNFQSPHPIPRDPWQEADRPPPNSDSEGAASSSTSSSGSTILLKLKVKKSTAKEVREDLRGVREDLRGVREDLRRTREDLWRARDEIRWLRQQMAPADQARRR